MNDTKKILIIDDDPDLTHILSDKLEKAGFGTSVAHSGKEGLAKATSEKPNLILLDVIMPEMDGLQMLTQLREDDWGKTAKVVLLTVMDDPESISKAVGMGVNKYFVKTDMNIDEVVAQIKEQI